MTIPGFKQIDDRDLLAQVVQMALGRTDCVGNLQHWFDFLLQQNINLNLVSRKLDRRTLIIEHIYDCLAGFSYFNNSSIIYDLGSGGGFPGILLAICFSEKEIHLIEKSPKKCQYLRKVKSCCKIPNLNIHEGLVDQVPVKGDTVTCRAFKPVDVVLRLTEDFLRGGGKYLFYKGRRETIESELQAVRKSLNRGDRKLLLNSTITPIAPLIAKERFMVSLEVTS